MLLEKPIYANVLEHKVSRVANDDGSYKWSYSVACLTYAPGHVEVSIYDDNNDPFPYHHISGWVDAPPTIEELMNAAEVDLVSLGHTVE